MKPFWIKQQQKRWFNIPNILSLVRIGLAFVVIILLIVSIVTPLNQLTIWWTRNQTTVTQAEKPANPIWGLNPIWFVATIIFIIAASTDWLDGYLARKYNLVSPFGKLIDPMADKLLVNGTILVLMLYPEPQTLPIWLGLGIILRDFVVDATRLLLAQQQIIVAANWFGKLKTIFQLIGLPILLLFNPAFVNWTIFSWQSYLILIPMMIALFFSLLSGIIYIVNGISALKAIAARKDKAKL